MTVHKPFTICIGTILLAPDLLVVKFQSVAG